MLSEGSALKTKIIDGKGIRDRILLEVAEGIAELPFVPKFCDVMVGSDPASLQYVGIKNKMAQKLGVAVVETVFPADVTTDAVVARIHELNAIENMSGIIVQLPLPAHLDKAAILNAIDPVLDIDCIGAYNSDRFYNSVPGMSFPTALAVVEILDSLPVDLYKKNIVMMGNGELVGKPVVQLLTRRNIPVTVIDSKTRNPNDILQSADIIISAIGKENSITGDMIQEGAIVIDAGTSESNGGVVGDVDQSTVIGKASMLAPVPGGVGPVTVAMLFRNLLETAESRA